jgi:hypothetical protein
MRVNMFMVSVAAGLILNTVADASEVGLPWDAQSLHAVSPAGIGPAAAGIRQYPQPDWTTVIGTGRAATAQGGADGGNSVSGASAGRYPNPDWTAAIGTGAAAALPRT